MRKRHTITKELKIQILKLHKINPQWKATKIKFELDKELKAYWKEEGPGIRAIQKIVSQGREVVSKSTLEKSWHLDTLDDFPIPPDIIPSILEQQNNFNKNITLRIVKWLTRLYYVLKGNDYYYWWACLYAEFEQMSEILGVPFDSTSLDSELYHKDPLSGPPSYYFLPMLIEHVLIKKSMMSDDARTNTKKLITGKIREALIKHHNNKPEIKGEGFKIGDDFLFCAFATNEFGKRKYSANPEKSSSFLLFFELQHNVPILVEAVFQPDFELKLWEILEQGNNVGVGK